MAKKGKRWIKDHQHERYYVKAKEAGFRARSAFKLIHILKKFPLLTTHHGFAKKIVDLGCAPGSWIEVIFQHYSEQPESIQQRSPPPQVLGIDLTSVRPFPEHPTFQFVRMDIFKPEIEAAIASWANGKVNVILSDLAPKTSGNDSDLGMQEAMVERVLELARLFLERNGHVAIKVFQSENTMQIIKKWTPYFENLKLFKPPSSQQTSRELYLIGWQFIGQPDIALVNNKEKNLDSE
jgi:23S rRNA U2552 (ribose-2'-O)-methylase RlmE/FtsJ